MKFKKYEVLIIILGIIFLSSCTKQPQLPIVEFNFENYQEGPAMVEFTNNSQFSETYIWNFGDDGFSKETNPTHQYLFPGDYTIKLKAINKNGNSYLEKQITIKGKAFSIKNYSQNTFDGVFSFYYNNDSIFYYYYGNLKGLEYTYPTYSKNSEVFVGYYKSNKMFVFTDPFYCVPDRVSVFNINEYLSGSFVDKNNLRNIN
jgi:PKD repeat protein